VSLRVVLYAEGTGDTGGEFPVPRPRPGDHLVDDFLGPAHLLVSRSIHAARPQLPTEAIRFEEPLRHGVRVARGSDLIHAPTVRRLLTWFPGGPAVRPDLAVVFVDRDGAQDRRAALIEAVRELPVSKVVGVAVEELESWLLGDPNALARVLPSATPPPEIEGLPPRQAKLLLQQWSAGVQPTPWQIRKSLAHLCDLATLQQRCPSFARFAADLSAALPQ